MIPSSFPDGELELILAGRLVYDATPRETHLSVGDQGVIFGHRAIFVKKELDDTLSFQRVTNYRTLSSNYVGALVSTLARMRWFHTPITRGASLGPTTLGRSSVRIAADSNLPALGDCTWRYHHRGGIGDNAGNVPNVACYYKNATNSGLRIGSGASGATGRSEGSVPGDLGNEGSYPSWNFASNWTGNEFGIPGSWVIGTVHPGGGIEGVSAPILVPDLLTSMVTGNSGSSVYSGSTVTPGYIATSTMEARSTLPSGIAITPNSVGPNVGTATIRLSVSGTLARPMTQMSAGSVATSGVWTIIPLSVTAMAKSASMTYGGPVPSLSGTLSATGPTGGLANISAMWTTPAASFSTMGQYAIDPTFSYRNGAVAKDFMITNAPSNATALTITNVESALFSEEIDVVTGMAADYMSTESDTSSISSFAAFSESLASPTPSESVMVFSDNFSRPIGVETCNYLVPPLSSGIISAQKVRP